MPHLLQGTEPVACCCAVVGQQAGPTALDVHREVFLQQRPQFHLQQLVRLLVQRDATGPRVDLRALRGELRLLARIGRATHGQCEQHKGGGWSQVDEVSGQLGRARGHLAPAALSHEPARGRFDGQRGARPCKQCSQGRVMFGDQRLPQVPRHAQQLEGFVRCICRLRLPQRRPGHACGNHLITPPACAPQC